MSPRSRKSPGNFTWGSDSSTLAQIASTFFARCVSGFSYFSSPHISDRLTAHLVELGVLQLTRETSREGDTAMTNIGEEKFKKILEGKQQEIEQTLRKRDGILVERSADTVDEVRQAAETELRIRNLEQESALLHNIRDALSRIEKGSFGICLDCGDEIAPRRLAAVPWTPLCVHCQTLTERQGQPVHAWKGVRLNAA